MRSRTLGLLAVAAMLLAACGGATGEDTTTSAVSGQEATTTPGDSGETTTSAAEMMDGVHVTETSVGEILVDPDGFALYVFTVDENGESSCYDDCASLWPPVSAATSISSDLDPAMFGSATRTDGGEQLTVNGMPLYLYTPDANPGDVNGQGFNDVWFVVDASGSMIEAAAGGITIDYGY